MDVRDRIETGFDRWGHWVYRHARPTIAAVLLLVAGLASQLPNLTIDTSTESFLHDDDPLRLTYDKFREQFGRDERIVVAIRSEHVFSFAFLEKLRSFHEAIEDKVPFVVDVTSLVNARNTRGEADQLIVEELLAEWPETEAELAALEQRVLASVLYQDQLISRDGRFTTLVIETEAYSSRGVEADALAGFEEHTADITTDRPFLTGEENSEIVQALSALVNRYRAADFEIYVAGAPVMVDELQSAMTRDMQRFVALGILSIAVLLALLFRRVAAVVLPLVVVILSVMSTLASMAIASVALKLPTQILPSFLLAVGVGNSVHVLAVFYQARRRGLNKEDATAFALAHSGLAIVMTSLTTAGGLLSFSVAELAPIAEFGLFGPLGAMIALAYTLVLLPALMAVFPMREPRAETTDRRPVSQRLLVGTGAVAIRHAGAIVSGVGALLVFCFVGALQLEFGHDPILWFKKGTPVRESTEVINRELHGSMYLEVLVDTHKENGLHDPEVLTRIEELQYTSRRIQVGDVYIGKTFSLVDVVKEIHQALNENRPEFYSIPEQRPLVAQELLLFENSGSDDLEDLVDSQFSLGRVTLKAPFVDAIQYQPFLERLDVEFANVLGDEADVVITGIMSVMARTMNALIRSMAATYVFAFFVITALMILLLGRFRIGLVSMIPNVAPILVTLGMMGWLGIPLDAFTLMVGSISLGLAVDDTIHFMHNFRRYYEKNPDVGLAVRKTLESTGQAMLFTSLVLATGFFLFMLASLNNLFYFGLLTGFTILMALLADLVLAPALMELVARPRRARRVDPTAMEATR